MNSRLFPYLSLAFAIFGLFIGCSDQNQNSNTQVFKTARDLVAERRVKQVEIHRDLAMSMLRTRSDITATPKNAPPATVETKTANGTETVSTTASKLPATDPTTQPINSQILVQADGMSMVIDLLDIEPKIEASNNQEHAILRQFIDGKLQGFDNQRLMALGFEHARPMLTYDLASTITVAEMEKSVQPSHLLKQQVVGDMYKVLIVQRGEIKLPITDAVIGAWHTSAGDLGNELGSAAIANLKQKLQAAGDSMIDTLPYGSAGMTGTLKSNVDPAVILLPEFLIAVQSQWKTQDNLVIQALSPAALTFVPEHNQALLDRLYPQWKGQLSLAKNPLCRELILRDDKALSYSSFKPTTKPTTAPTTKPRTIFVH